MRFKFTTSSNIFDFPDFDYGREAIESFIKETTNNIKNEHLADWTITFNALFTNGTSVNISKRGLTYTNDKEKEIIIQVPIPTKNQVSWGIEKERFAVRPPIVEKYFTMIPVFFNDYLHLRDLIIKCVELGIRQTLAEGITIQKQKIKS